MVLKFGIFAGFVSIFILVDDLLLVQKGSKFSFYRFGPKFCLFLAQQIRSSGYLEQSKLGLSEFDVRRLLFLGLIQH